MQGKSVQIKGNLNDSKLATGEGLITQSLQASQGTRPKERHLGMPKYS